MNQHRQQLWGQGGTYHDISRKLTLSQRLSAGYFLHSGLQQGGGFVAKNQAGVGNIIELTNAQSPVLE